jgi:nucleoside-diphosphate-sugar epimerase
VSDTKIVIPGGAGLVGQNLVVRLLARGWSNLVVLDKHARNLDVLRSLHPGIVAEHADLSAPGPWQRHFANAGAVVMLQAQIGAKTAEPFVRNNVTATENVLDAMRTHGVPYLVHVSSSVVQSVADDEYTRTKRRQEEIVRASGIDAIVLRPTLMFGWFDRKHLGWLSRFMRRVPVFPIPGHGRYPRQPLYVGDFCDIIERCLERRPSGQCLNISGIDKIDYVDMIRTIRDAARARTAIVHIPYALFDRLLRTWAVFDADPPFTTDQLEALTAGDEFEVIDWQGLFGVQRTPFADAVRETFQDPRYSSVVLDF